MHPLDTVDRLELLKDDLNIGLCNITKCCTEVCPEHIKITDNAIIPLKERVADRYYDPFRMIWRRLRGGAAPDGGTTAPTPLSAAPSASDPADLDVGGSDR
jgi:succinate dehydrogenase / fumarate reductase iron-sulfur subunit